MIQSAAIDLCEGIGSRVLSQLSGCGKATIFLWHILNGVVRRPFRTHLFLTQTLQVGVNSSLVIGLIGFFTGAVLAVQAEHTLSNFGAVAFTGSAVALSLIRELGPVLTALMVIGRAGSAMTAELGIMRISEQIDALRSMAVDPVRYLMVPRFLAGIVVMPMLTAIFIVVGIFGGMLVGVGLLGLSEGTFSNSMISAVETKDVYAGLIKAIVFGFIFGWVSTYKGYTCGFGAVGVNRATTQSVVTASVAVLVIDYFLSSILTRVLY